MDAAAPVATVRMSTAPPMSGSTTTPITAASTTVFTSGAVTARMRATLPVPDTAPTGKPNAVLAVPPVTSTLLAEPAVSLATERPDTGSATALAPRMRSLTTAATSEAEALPPRSGNTSVCSGPSSICTTRVSPAATANGPLLTATMDAGVPLNTASWSAPPFTERTMRSPSVSRNGPELAPSSRAGVGTPGASR